MYTLFIRSYFDTDGDGVGDFSGVAEKVDYLKSLGVDTVWFLPFNKSKSYHGYDVEDYYDVEPDYGTLQDLDNMIKVLNENGIKVVMDLVVNHTSDTHPWFLDAVENTTNSPYWNYYIMSLDEPQNKDHWHYEINSSGQKVWYFGLFDSSMPDLNYDNPKVMDEVKKIIDFWADMGVDGFRLDAAKHYYGFDWSDGIEQSASVAKEIEDYIKDKLGENAIVVSEVYDGDSNVLLKFAPMPVFNFSFMYNLRGNFEGRDNLISDSISWIDSSLYNLNVFHFPFIDSHDLDRFISELVDSKYQGDVISATKQYLLVNALLLSLTGMPTIYYGDEIGLRGWKWHSEPWDIPVREPMQWYKDQKGNGQTYWTKEFYGGITVGSANEDGAIYDDPDDGVSVEEQENGYSILNFFKEFINLRKEYPALAFGNTTIERDWKNLYVLKKSNNFQDVLVLINLDPTYSNTYEIPEGYKWVWYAFFDGDNYEFGEKDEMILQNTGWTINPRQIYIFVK
jgi:glycosidase